MRSHHLTRDLKGLFIFFLVAISSSGRAEGQGGESKPEKKPRDIVERIESTRTRLQLIEQTIMTLNKKKDCDGDGNCEVLEIGSRICGGPSDHVIVSDANPKLSEVKQKIIEYTSVEKELNLIDPPMTCPPAPKEPEVHCIKQICARGSGK